MSTKAKTMEPELIYWDGEPRTGFALLLRGHDLPPDEVEALASREGYESCAVTEVWLHKHPRVMWCERINGFGCDENGEWHAHWEEVRPSPLAKSAKWTLITRAEVTS